MTEQMRFRVILVCVGLVLSIAGLFSLRNIWPLGVYSKDDSGELAQKREWSVLQGLEYEYRYKVNNSIVVIRQAKGTEYDALGLPLADRNIGYAWILANPSSDPRVKLMPTDARVRLSQNDLKRIRNGLNIDRAVLSFLEQAATK